MIKHVDDPVWQMRANVLRELMKNKENFTLLRAYYETLTPESLVDFVSLWGVVYEPRALYEDKKPLGLRPYQPFEKQKEFLHELLKSFIEQHEFIVEKSRDVGATWTVILFYVYLFLFCKDVLLGVYSYKEDAVDSKGSEYQGTTLLGKFKFILRYIPTELSQIDIVNKKEAYSVKTKEKVVQHPKNKNSIWGLSGEQVNRGGRFSSLFSDEFDFYDHQLIVEGAQSELTSNRIIQSTYSPNLNTVFFNKVHGGISKVFNIDWFSNPDHTKELYEKKKLEADVNGLLTIFAREIDCNPYNTNANTLISLELIKVINNVPTLPFIENNKTVLGFDVAGSGVDVNAVVIIKGNTIIHIETWGASINSGGRVFQLCLQYSVNTVVYDSVGVGYEVGNVMKRLRDEYHENNKNMLFFEIVGWIGNATPKYASSYVSSEYNREGELFYNLKAQAWSFLRKRLMYTNILLTDKYEELGYKVDSFDDLPPDAQQKFEKFAIRSIVNDSRIYNEVCQALVNYSNSGKLLIEKTPEGSKSPNIADALVMCAFQTYD